MTSLRYAAAAVEDIGAGRALMERQSFKWMGRLRATSTAASIGLSQSQQFHSRLQARVGLCLLWFPGARPGQGVGLAQSIKSGVEQVLTKQHKVQRTIVLPPNASREVQVDITKVRRRHSVGLMLSSPPGVLASSHPGFWSCSRQWNGKTADRHHARALLHSRAQPNNQAVDTLLPPLRLTRNGMRTSSMASLMLMASASSECGSGIREAFLNQLPQSSRALASWTRSHTLAQQGYSNVGLVGRQLAAYLQNLVPIAHYQGPRACRGCERSLKELAVAILDAQPPEHIVNAMIGKRVLSVSAHEASQDSSRATSAEVHKRY